MSSGEARISSSKIDHQRRGRTKRDLNHVFKKAIAWEEVLPEVAGHIKKDPHAQTALDILVKARCDPERILMHAYLYAGDDERDADAAKRDYAWWANHIEKVVEELEALAGQVERITAYLYGIGIDATSPRSAWELRSCADALKTVEPFLKELASQRVSRRDDYLLYLADVVKTITGREHYKELAAITDAVRFVYDPSNRKRSTAEDVRYKVRRYCRQVLKSASGESLGTTFERKQRRR
jgi:hypothetical protein